MQYYCTKNGVGKRRGISKKAHIPLDDSYPYNLEVLIILESPLSDSTDLTSQ